MEAYGEIKMLFEQKLHSTPSKKPDQSFAFSNINKAEFFKILLDETFQP